MPEFSSTEDAIRWLKGQIPEDCLVFAAQAALRAVPAFKVMRRPQSVRALGMFRCVASAWATAAYPRHHNRLVWASQRAFNSVDQHAQFLQRSESAVIFAVAAAAAAHKRDVISTACEATISAIDASALTGRASCESMLGALASDARQLAQGFEPGIFALQPLWPPPTPIPPEWARNGWEALKVALLAEDKSWEVWTDWYEDRVFGHFANTALEVARVAEVPDDTWKADPEIANEHIGKLSIEHSNRGTTAEEYDPPNPQDSVAFQQWLSAKPREWAAVIAVRAATRMVGLMAGSPGDTSMLSIFRAISASRYSVLNPKHKALASEASAFLNERDTQIKTAAFYATEAAWANDEASSRAVTIVSDLGRKYDPMWIGSVFRDATLLVQGVSLRQLAHEPLWQPVNEGGIPLPQKRLAITLRHDEPSQSWRALAKLLLDNGEHWKVWVDWYNYILQGSPPAIGQNDAWETAFLGIPGPLPWDSGPKAVNTEIAARLGARQLTVGEPSEVAAGPDPLPLDNVQSPIAIFQRSDGRIGADAGTLAEPYLPLPLTEADHARHPFRMSQSS